MGREVNLAAENIGVYIHIPFCRKKCLYCDFCSVEQWDDRLMDAYLDALLLQMSEVFSAPGSLKADSVYIGGGTPSVFGGKRLGRLMSALGKKISLTRQCEITLEVNPESVDKGLVKAAKSCGVNRISMGVQSANDGQLRALGRLHTFDEACRATELVKKYCTENISLDLMYGLPGQDLESWQQSVEAVLGLGPKHLSCYGLKLEEGTPLHRAHPLLPDDDLQADMYFYACRRLAESGFEHYEISNFALGGFRARHNSKYWSLAPYIGLGCAAHSFFAGRRYSSVGDVEGFVNNMKAGGHIIDEMDEEAHYDRLGEYIMLGLRTSDGISESAVSDALGRQDVLAGAFAKYVAAGMAQRKGDVWRLTEKGFLISNTIISDIMCCCEEAPGVMKADE